MKRIWNIGISSLVIASLSTSVCFAQGEVPPDAKGRWYERYVSNLQEEIASTILVQGNYLGQEKITVEDFITLTAKSLSLDAGKIAKLFPAGQREITRDEAVVVIKALGTMCHMDTSARSYTYLKPQFSDEMDLSQEAKDAYDFAFRNGYMLGLEGEFRPKEHLTRGEAAIILSKMKDDVTLAATYEGKDPIFKMEGISSAYAGKMQGFSYKENEFITVEDLRLLTMSYYGFDGKVHVGQMVVNADIAQDTLHVFEKMLQEKCPIERMIPIDRFVQRTSFR